MDRAEGGTVAALLRMLEQERWESGLSGGPWGSAWRGERPRQHGSCRAGAILELPETFLS